MNYISDIFVNNVDSTYKYKRHSKATLTQDHCTYLIFVNHGTNILLAFYSTKRVGGVT